MSLVSSPVGSNSCIIPAMTEADCKKHPNARIAVFAREPRLGQVKSRLAKGIGETEALALYEAMLARTAALAEQSGLAEWNLWVTSNRSHESFLTLCNKKNIYVQQGSDLGARMAYTIEQTLGREGIDSLVVIGTDCPALTLDYLDHALTALDTGVDVVLGPAEDGGYVLIGVRQPQGAIFEGIDWGTDKVLSQTLALIAKKRLRWLELDVLWDVDRLEDLDRLASLEPPLIWV